MTAITVIDRDGVLDWYQSYLSECDASSLFEHLLQTTNWQQREVRIMGKSVAMPRLTALFGDHAYAYSNQNQPNGLLTGHLLSLQKRLSDLIQIDFNSVLLNLYRDGQDSIAWHADNEKALGDKPTIASLSLGASRRFLLKHKTDGESVELSLSSGDLILMHGDLQSHWKHSIPKTKRPVGARINATFRVLQSSK